MYQLCTTKEAQRAVRNNSLDHFSSQTQIWIQPSFGWSAVRSGYGSKLQVIQVDISKDGFLYMLKKSCLSRFEPNPVHPTKQEWDNRRRNASVTVQWEEDLDIKGNGLGYDCMRLGLTGEAQTRYIQDWVLNVSDATKQIREIWNILGHGWDYDEDQIPNEAVYPLSDEHTISMLGLTVDSH
ncbi:hypothetical protein F1880_001916 [Penicillium rolfsii]|nr:hypothetical protein F1880_001916 [Penicillium rolfsii]